MNYNRIRRVVVVYGESGTGKTTTLCELCESLMNKHQSQFTLQRKGCKTRLKTMPKRKGVYQDVICAIHCRDKNGKQVLVGIGTAGDDWSSVERNFMFFDSVYPEEEFEFVFIAIRKEKRRDGLGVAEKSFPLMALERIESDGQLNVLRPFEVAPNTTNIATVGVATFIANCNTLAANLESMI